MISLGREVWEGWMDLLYPPVCAGCAEKMTDHSKPLCLSCVHGLPFTQFHLHAGNPVEKIFWGRIPVQSAASYLYFTKHSPVQHLLHQLKYRGNKQIGLFLGEKMGEDFRQSGRFNDIDAIVPLPLFRSRERKRGYNQSAILAEGYSKATGLPVYPKVIRRRSATATQTHKSRMERWQNMEGRFELTDPHLLKGKSLLLIDDVLTTGATLEACSRSLLEVPGISVSIATLAYTSS